MEVTGIMLTWAVILLLLGIIILIAEFFIPSSGILGVLATLAIIGAITLGFMHSLTAGTAFVVAAIIVVPIVLLGAIKYWPHTPMGRSILITPPADQDDVLPETPTYRKLPELIGQRGLAKTEMLPGGTVEIQGKRYDAVSEGMPIDAGQPVLVVRIETQRLVVRPAERPAAALPEHPISPTQPMHSESPQPINDPLASPVKSPFDEPLL